MDSPRIVVFGSIIQDLIRYSLCLLWSFEFVARAKPAFHPSGMGELVPPDLFGIGSAANCPSAGRGNLLYRVYQSKVGDDVLGEENINGLRECGVNVTAVEKSASSSTGVACITVDATGLHSLVSATKGLFIVRDCSDGSY
ncbi:unnamed protein product [Heligmosomoides polygyrus]|uniref:PfkB domain-containing protein n=1 Tax=Heligmosomoides polygyrus TaxID=6339 RepID=A0A3P8AHZ8_HELPZ|nr:unnamed protein product [Heligmosomoides polygyrus]